MYSGDGPDEFGDFNGYRPPAKRSQIDDFGPVDAELVLDGYETPDKRRQVARVIASGRWTGRKPHGGHRHNSGWQKSEFPEGWGAADVTEWVHSIMVAPSGARPTVEGFELLGSHRGVRGTVKIAPVLGTQSWYVSTAHPV